MENRQETLTVTFVCCTNDLGILERTLYASPCIRDGSERLIVHVNARSAAEAFNTTMEAQRGNGWLVWVHQDVYLPAGWLSLFRTRLVEACQRFPRLAVAGVYGIAGAGDQARRAGHVLDRGHLLREPTPLPCLVDSLDELLVAVRIDTALKMDPELGFDFYATDLVLHARDSGYVSAVIDACCEHRSSTPPADIPYSVAQRIARSGEAFERKWSGRFPITTPCVDIRRSGDVAALAASLTASPA